MQSTEQELCPEDFQRVTAILFAGLLLNDHKASDFA